MGGWAERWIGSRLCQPGAKACQRLASLRIDPPEQVSSQRVKRFLQAVRLPRLNGV